MAVLFQRPPIVLPAYYVSTTGSDTDPGTLSQPFRTINKGVSVAVAGDTVYVRGTGPSGQGTGIFDEVLSNPAMSGSSWASPVTVSAYPGETVWMRPSSGAYAIYLNGSQQYVVFTGINLDGSDCVNGAFKVEASGGHDPKFIRLSNCEAIGPSVDIGQTPQIVIADAQFSGATGGHEFINVYAHGLAADDFSHCFYIKTPNTTVNACECEDFPGAGIHLFGSFPLPGCIITQNVVHDGRSGAAGQRHWGIIIADGANGAFVANNLVYAIPNDGGSSVALFDLAAGGVEFYNNTAADNAGEGIAIQQPSVVGDLVKNNISYGNTGGNYRDDGTGTVTATNLVAVNPLFVNAAARNYHVQTPSSPALNAGTTLASVPTDIVVVVRPSGQYTIGAYQD